MTTYLVKWELHVEADSKEEAASIALAEQGDPDTIATVFEVHSPEGVCLIDAVTGSRLRYGKFPGFVAVKDHEGGSTVVRQDAL